MKLNLQLLARKHPDLDETIKGLVAQVDAMAQIADAFSRYANIPELQIREFDLNEMLRTNMLVHQHEKVNFIDKTSEKVLFTGDPDQLTRAVNNLVKNALQAGHEGNTPNVEVVLEASISEVLIHIVDDGVGIPRDKQESIFEPRFTTKTGGMGLGLSIVRTIIDGHGGKIDLKSTKGKGSEFTVHLPRK
jgi:signal transduction histidine kinase